MKYKFLGKTGVQVSSLCMGTMTFGKEADEAASALLYKRCRDAGINFFDTANMYADGLSETILGKLIRGERENLILASKVYFQMGKDINQHGLSRKHIMQAIDGSLKRLGTDYLDIYYLHRFDDNTDLEETLYAFNDLVRQGKVLYLGVSNFAAWQIMKGLAISAREHLARFACMQPMYNLLKRQAEVELFPLALEEKLAVFPYNPLAGGVLSGKYLEGASEGRLLSVRTYQLRYGTPETPNSTVSSFVAYAKERGLHPVSLALSWAASHPAVTAPILGARSVAQLEPALQSLDISMTEDLRTDLSSLSLEPPPATDRIDERSPEATFK
jgi:aryl-alcohol dehydrogenase-like predicted oxidoreductase